MVEDMEFRQGTANSKTFAPTNERAAYWSATHSYTQNQSKIHTTNKEYFD